MSKSSVKKSKILFVKFALNLELKLLSSLRWSVNLRSKYVQSLVNFASKAVLLSVNVRFEKNWDFLRNSGPARRGSGIPIYPLFCPRDTNIPQNRKMCFTKYLKLFWIRILNTWKWTSRNMATLNKYYYTFKIFPRFWLAKNTRIIPHDQLLMTKFGRILRLINRWRQKGSFLAS